jgi:hypothetical protein
MIDTYGHRSVAGKPSNVTMRCQLILKRDKFEFERGAAAKKRNTNINPGRKNRYHDCDGAAGS